MDIWVLKSACSKQGNQCSDQVFPMTYMRLWKNVEFQASSKAAKPVGNVSDIPPHVWHTLGTDLFYWNKVDCLCYIFNFACNVLGST